MHPLTPRLPSISLNLLLGFMLAAVSIPVARGAEAAAFFGLGAQPGGAQTAAQFNSMLPEGMAAIRFGMPADALLAERQKSPTSKVINVGNLYSEEVELENRKPEALVFYSFRYNYDDDAKTLNSVQMEAYYDDPEFKFPRIRSLLSASFQSFGKPSRVIKMKSDGSDKTPVMYIYWKSGEYNLELWIARSITKNRINLRWIAGVPRKDHKPYVPVGGEESTPEASAFAKLYDTWLTETAR